MTCRIHGPGTFGRLGRHRMDDVEITDDMRAIALKRTNDTIVKLEEIRQARELPVEMLPLVANIHDSVMFDLTAIEMRKAQDAEQAKHEADEAKWQAEARTRYPTGHNFMGQREMDDLNAQWGSLVGRHASRIVQPVVASQEEVILRSPRAVKPAPVDEDEYRATRVIARPQYVAFRPEQIRITSAHPERFVIADILIGNRPQLLSAGELPGDALSSAAFDNMLHFDTCQTAMDIEFRVRYIGNDPEGEVFEAKVTGTAAR